MTSSGMQISVPGRVTSMASDDGKISAPPSSDSSPPSPPSPPPPSKMRGRRNPSGTGTTLVESKPGEVGPRDNSFYNLSMTPDLVERKMIQQNEMSHKRSTNDKELLSPKQQPLMTSGNTTDDSDSSSVEYDIDLERGSDYDDEEDDFYEEDVFGDNEFDVDDNDSFMSSDTSRFSGGSEGYRSSDGTSFNSKSTNVNDGETTKIAKRQAIIVFWCRVATICCLLVLGCLFVAVIFWLERDQEEDAFFREFERCTDIVGHTWQIRVTALFISLDALAVDVSLATTGMSWPLITVPEYAIYANSLRNKEPSIVSTALLPVVSERDRVPYERYIMDNQQWINATLDWQEMYGEDEEHKERVGEPRVRRRTQEVSFVNGIADKIYSVDFLSKTAVVENGPSPYYPIRTIDPLTKTESINYNVGSNLFLNDSVVSSHERRVAVFGPVVSDDDHIPENRTHNILGTMTYPILDSYSGEGEMVGVLSAIFDWMKLLKDILPDQAQAMSCVVENSCNQTFTLEINEDKVSMIGEGDLHDRSYTEYGKKYDLSKSLTDLPKATLSKISFDTGSRCQVTVTMYPSATSRDAYNSKVKNDAAIVTGIIFFLVLLVFLIFDCIQEHRNRKVKRRAQEARDIVSSLFPASVRDRLFETNREKARQKRKEKKKEKRRRREEKRQRKKFENYAQEAAPTHTTARTDNVSLNDRDIGFLSVHTVKSIMNDLEDKAAIESDDDGLFSLPRRYQGVVSHPKHRLKTFLKSSPISDSGMNGSGIDDGIGNPIADLFPHTTVLFADIVGFTAWSSEREPEQVFALLQTLYQSFDKLAKKRGVFKVETIGDCYVAVTGLPEPQQDHAVRMTKFARECMYKMTEVTRKLEVSLGPDTGDLCLRCGLNSGPVTAGVLIGEKSRFQLFGDTVNTASRMESTGEPNRIQISASTADLLKQAGKTYWVRPREDLVHAKGKGNIQTFWVVSKGGTNPEGQNNNESRRWNLRQAPSRTQSMKCIEPVRGVQRTTSDSLGQMVDASANGSKMLASQSNDTLDVQREERLIQWQLEMFTKLLKRIVAARMKKQGCQIEFQLTRENFEMEKTEVCVLPMNDSSASEQHLKPQCTSSNRFSIAGGPLKQGGSNHRPCRQDSLKKPPARKVSLQSFVQSSVSTLFSSQVSVLGSSNGDLSFSPSVGTQPDTQASVPGKEEEEGADLDRIVVDEVAEVIHLPQFSPEATKAMTITENINLSKNILSQLHDYIATIAHMYRNNPFHNFEHASHVTMSAAKLLNRIVVPENIDYDRETNDVFSDLHDYTYGITSDPLTQFAVVFSALIHDVDHYGVPNGQLAKENPEMAVLYRDKSIAEQNSVDLAWDLLLDPMYKDLRDCIATDKEEKRRFRQLVVNSVMATDIFDKDMKELRNSRWDKAFHCNSSGDKEISDFNIEEDRNRKATIVIEHIIQASDVAHTMQHWHIYTKWNERLFGEMYSAYECGRAEKNPAEGWYKGELWFFDNYVIPLAKKLEECNVFGVASDECLNYATANRNEWEAKGEEIVAQMVARYQKKKFFVAGRAKTKAPSRKDIIKPKKRNQQ